MQSKDIKVGTRYSWARFGSSRRYGVRREHLVQVSIVSEPKQGYVDIKTHQGPGNPSMEVSIPVKEIIETWAETQESLKAQADAKAELVAEQDKITARWKDLDFEVCGDGSYSTRINFDRSTLAEIIEAAYEAGVADGQGLPR
jgi:hypothetical protein